MPNITATNTVSLSSLLGNIQQYKFNPSMIQESILTYLKAVTNGQVDIVDPTNPFVFSLEASSVSTAAAIIESEINLRKQYPVLAITEDDVYLHMSDKSFIDRFATPASSKFTFMIEKNSLLQNLVDDPTESCKKAIIARNTEVTVNGLTFSLQYPIVIRQFYTGGIQIAYDASVVSPLRALKTNIIDYNTRVDGNGVSWVYFEVDMDQFSITSSSFPVVSVSYFSQNISFKDSFYYCRVFYSNTSTGGSWVEMTTTFTDQVFDPLKPTALLKISGQSLNVMIPQVYINSQMVDGNIRVDVYQTKGPIDVDMSNYQLTAFDTVFMAIDTVSDYSEYTAAMNDVVYLAYNANVVVGGTPALTFEQLREGVVYNSIGDRKLPITNVQVQGYAAKLGFNLVPNVDVVTNRIFLATRDLPLPKEDQFVTPASVSIQTLMVTLDQLATLSGVKVNNNRTTLTPSILYKINNGIISIFSATDLQALMALTPGNLADTVNSSNFLYTPFYYVLDNTQNEFSIRAYSLDNPSSGSLGFISQNPLAQAQVNTQAFKFTKTTTGYKLQIVTKSDAQYKAIPDSQVSVQLSFIPQGEKDRAYINGTLTGTSGGERVFEFNIDTNYDLDSNDNLWLTSLFMYTTAPLSIAALLDQSVDIVYATTAVPNGFIPDQAQSKLGMFLLDPTSIAITNETLDLHFGDALTNLWKQSRSITTGLDYKTYTADVPMLYESDVYQIDPTTGSIISFDAGGNAIFTVLHKQGDPVLDAQGNQVYSHRAGDVVLDAGGNPVSLATGRVIRNLDMMFIEGVYYFANNPITKSYLSSVSSLLTSWTVNDIAGLDSVLLEETQVYLYPKKSIGQIAVLVNNADPVTIDSAQSFTVDLYLSGSVYNNMTLRGELETVTISTIGQSLSNKVVSISDIVDSLRTAYSSDVVAVRVRGLGGDADYETVTVVDDHTRLSLKKRLAKMPDESLVVQEAVTFNFYLYQPGA